MVIIDSQKESYEYIKVCQEVGKHLYVLHLANLRQWKLFWLYATKKLNFEFAMKTKNT